MGEIPLDVAVANRFISSLSKSLQALCHGCMDFDSGIEIIGYINVNIDRGSNVDYVLNEKVQKSRDNSMTFVSNSFLAKKDKSKQLRDGVCSPVPELQQPFSYSSHHSSGYDDHSPYPPYQSQILRGAHKRQWSGRDRDRDWRAQRKFSRKSHTAAFTGKFSQQSSSIPLLPAAQSPHLLNESVNNESEVHIKQEVCNDNIKADLSQNDHLHNDSNLPLHDASDTTNQVKFESDNRQKGDESAGDDTGQASTGDSHAPEENQLSFPAGSDGDDQMLYNNPSTSDNFNQSENAPNFDQSYDNTAGDNSDLTVSFGEQSGDMSGYPQTSYNEQGEASGEGANFECIEIDDDEEAEFQSIFGDNRTSAFQSFTNQFEDSRNAVGLENTQTQYKCHICDRGFTVRAYLTRHMKLHSGTKPYKCAFCPMSFSRKDRLRNHENVHTGHRPYACHVPGCQTQYSHQTSLNYHLKVVHGIFLNHKS